MKNRIKDVLCLSIVALLLGGCSMRTVDQMYQLPKRSEDFSNLQLAIDAAMTELEFCAPLSGDNQQTVQMADVDGDDRAEYLVFAKGSTQQPLRILVFDRQGERFLHIDTIQSNGTAFDQVEYIQMDDKPGLEMVVGRKFSDQLVRSVSVYTFSGGEAEQLIATNYQKFITSDVDDDSRNELFILRPGQTETDNGVAELYSVNEGIVERSNEVNMSCPVDQLRRILVGKLNDNKTAVYVASAVGDTSLITDVYTVLEERLTNVSMSGDADVSVQTLRNYYVYADDIDDDGVIELPMLVSTVPLVPNTSETQSNLVLWYALSSDGSVTQKVYTYYVATAGWYLELEEELVAGITVNRQANTFEFFLWNADYSKAQKLFTIHTLTGQKREEQSTQNDRFILLKTDTVTYAAELDAVAADYQITQQSLINSFHQIHRNWNTGET